MLCLQALQDDPGNHSKKQMSSEEQTKQVVKWPPLDAHTECHKKAGLHAQSTPRLSVSLLCKCEIMVTVEKSSSDDCTYIYLWQTQGFL